MSNASSKRSVMTLFSNKNDIYCHQVKIVLAEKGVAYENEEVDLQALSEDLMELNPYGTLPTLVDRDLVLFSSRIIMEYLDERFPHPPLMPVYPVSRAKSRLLMLRIEQDWYPTLEIAEKGTEVERVAPLLWKLRNMGVEFSGTGSKAIKGYMDRVFSRDSFLQSVGEAAPKNLMDDK